MSLNLRRLGLASQPHIILIMTDQQRFDSIGALGAPWMSTPNLDMLVQQGVSFTNCFVNSPVCVTARASLFTGKYPHKSGIFHNFQPWTPTWVNWLSNKGYHCANIGKMHINPYHELGGFHQRFVVENKDRPLFLEDRMRAFYDEWDKALKSHGISKPSRYSRYKEDPLSYESAIGCFPWTHSESLHSDFFVGDTANWWLEERKSESPLFLQIGFPGPHPPYDPSPRFLKIYENSQIPVPRVSQEEITMQPRAQAVLRQNMIDFNFDSVRWKNTPSEEELLKLRRHYAANVSMIDEKVGEIIQILKERKYLENTIFIFTSDHADALGDHGHIQKWTMYDSVLRVPLVIWAPGSNLKPKTVGTPVELMDVGATIIEACGIDTPHDWDARSLWPRVFDEDPPSSEVVYAELAQDHIQTGSEFIVMRRDPFWKLVWYAEGDGELYDLKSDPHETRNLWHSKGHSEKRDELLSEVKERTLLGLFRSKKTETPQPQQPMKIK
jgi:arylsulfatase